MTPEELTQLDRECADALGYSIKSDTLVVGGIPCGDRDWYYDKTKKVCMVADFYPTKSKKQWAELLERFDIGLISYRYREGKYCDKYYVAPWTHPMDSSHYSRSEEGPTPGVAIVRAVIAAAPITHGES